MSLCQLKRIPEMPPSGTFDLVFKTQHIENCRKAQAFLQFFALASLLHVILVGLDHLLDHLAADGAGLTTGQITVVAVLQVDTNLSYRLLHIKNGHFFC